MSAATKIKDIVRGLMRVHWRHERKIEAKIRKLPFWQIGRTKDLGRLAGAHFAFGLQMHDLLQNIENLLREESPKCGQCGQPFPESACGPTHALIAHETQAFDESLHEFVGHADHCEMAWPTGTGGYRYCDRRRSHDVHAQKGA